MKTIEACILFCILIACNNDHGQVSNTNLDSPTSQQTDTIMQTLLKIDKKIYIGKPVDSFLTNDLISKYIESYFFDSKPGLLTSLKLMYSNNNYIEIIVEDYKYLNPFSTKRDWDINLFKKEKVSEIRLLHDDEVVEAIR